MSRRRLRAGWVGRVDYAAATAIQEEIRAGILDGREDDHLLLLEHPHVYTLGRNAASEDVLASPAWLAERGVELHESDRGGQVTYHGPGQLVGYPVLDLKPERRDVRRYVRDLQEVLIRTLADVGVEATPGLDGLPVGVWVGPRKIASIGVHLRQWVTTHGFALNLAPDLSFFSGIVACGLPAAPITSVEEQTGAAPTPGAIAERVERHFRRVFDRYDDDSLAPSLPSACRMIAGGRR